MENKNINILIVDDNAEAQITFSRILRLKGYNAQGASTGAEAVSMVKNKFFNIILIDIRLPDLSGLEVLKSIREISEETVPIMVTAYASMDSSVEAMNKGAYSYVTKPINMEQTLAVIERGLEKQKLSMENKRLLQELQAANEKLKELDKRKSYFVANVSHEFKSPLAIIKESLSIILDGLVGEISTNQRQLLETSKQNIERLVRLISNLLDLSRIEAGKVEIKIEKVKLLPLIEEILVSYAGEIVNKRLNLKKEVSPDAGFIWADRDRIAEVIINLLTNAIKYTPQGGSITVNAGGDEKEARFEISDTGPGISKEYYEKIFDKFERITAEREEGTGLGLPIAKDIVELHKGKLWVESEIGKGSRFIFLLPRKC